MRTNEHGCTRTMDISNNGPLVGVKRSVLTVQHEAIEENKVIGVSAVPRET